MPVCLRMSSMANVLTTEKRVQIVSVLVEGCDIRATARMVGISKDTVMKLWREIEEACIRYQDETFQELTCKRLQVNEIWSFVYVKAKNVLADRRGRSALGMSGPSRPSAGTPASRLVNRVQLTTDGHEVYLSALEDAFEALSTSRSS